MRTSLTRKYFGDTDPIGQAMHEAPDRDFVVSAMFEDYPKQSHYWFDYIIPFEYLGTLDYGIDLWNNSGYHTYVAVSEGTNRELAVEKIEDFLKPKPTLEEFAKLDLQPNREIHLTTGYDFEGANTIEKKYLRIFLDIGIFLIVIECINLMNLARPGFKQITETEINIDYTNSFIYIPAGIRGAHRKSFGYVSGLLPFFLQAQICSSGLLRGAKGKKQFPEDPGDFPVCNLPCIVNGHTYHFFPDYLYDEQGPGL